MKKKKGNHFYTTAHHVFIFHVFLIIFSQSLRQKHAKTWSYNQKRICSHSAHTDAHFPSYKVRKKQNKTKQKKKESFSTYKGYDSWKSGAEMTRQWEPSNHLAFYTWVVVSQEQKVVTRNTSKAPTYVWRFEALQALRPVWNFSNIHVYHQFRVQRKIPVRGICFNYASLKW